MIDNLWFIDWLIYLIIDWLIDCRGGAGEEYRLPAAGDPRPAGEGAGVGVRPPVPPQPVPPAS